jgi:hypothetical protein
VDEIKEFEKRLEMDFELAKNIQKIEIKLPEEWIAKMKNRLLHTLKTKKP